MDDEAPRIDRVANAFGFLGRLGVRVRHILDQRSTREMVTELERRPDVLPVFLRSLDSAIKDLQDLRAFLYHWGVQRRGQS